MEDRFLRRKLQTGDDQVSLKLRLQPTNREARGQPSLHPVLWARPPNPCVYSHTRAHTHTKLSWGCNPQVTHWESFFPGLKARGRAAPMCN